MVGLLGGSDVATTVRALVAGSPPPHALSAPSDRSTPTPAFAPLVKFLLERLKSPAVETWTATSPGVQRHCSLVKTQLCMLNLAFTTDVDDYPYPPPYAGRFPYGPSLEALDNAVSFFDCLSYAAASVDIAARDVVPRDESCLARAQAAEDTWVKEVVARPVPTWAALRSRLDSQGQAAPFPEFAPMLENLRLRVDNGAVALRVAGNRALQRHHEYVVHRLGTVAHDLPYEATLAAVKGATAFFDCLAEDDASQHPEPLYHVDRYSYYWWSMVNNPNVVLLPTFTSLSFTDLIKVRAAPLGFLGIVDKTTFVDRHRQSPLDFLIHDLNHSRRMVGYDEQHLRDLGVPAGASGKVFAAQAAFIEESLLPLITLEGKTADARLMARLMRLIVFEILHESALCPTPEHMLADLHRAPGSRLPFEHMRLPSEADEVLDDVSIERRRTRLGNITSGIRGFDYPDGPIRVRYFRDRAVILLGNVYNKMVHGFYDEWFDPKIYVCKAGDRSAHNLARAAQQLLAALGDATFGLEELEARCKMQRGSEERFTYPRAMGAPAQEAA